MSSQRFRTTLQLHGRTANGSYTYRNTVVPRGGQAPQMLRDGKKR
jgi:hypothetical protein